MQLTGLFTRWAESHGPLIAFGVTLVVAFAGRYLRLAVLSPAAGGAGVAAGWFAIIGRTWALQPGPSIGVLPLIAGAMLVLGVLWAWFGRQSAAIALVIAAVAIGWWLSGAPLHQAALRSSWPLGLAIAVIVFLFARSLTGNALDPWRLALAGLTLAGSLHVVPAPPIWSELALAAGLASLALVVLPSTAGFVALPVAVDTAALASAAVLLLGRLPRLGIGPVDLAALSPLLAIWLAPQAAAKLRFVGRAGPATGYLIAGALAVGCVWAGSRLLPH